MYQGKETSGNENYKKEFGFYGSELLNFFEALELAYLQRKFSLYFDSFFNSLKLLDVIRERGHGVIGTVRSKRLENFPIAEF